MLYITQILCALVENLPDFDCFHYRSYPPLEWSFLFFMGHRVRQNPYSNHRLRVGASAHHLGLLLL